MSTIVLENIKGAELAGRLVGLNPEKSYYISIQPLDEREEEIKAIEEAFNNAPKNTEFANMTEEEIMKVVDQETQKSRKIRALNNLAKWK